MSSVIVPMHETIGRYGGLKLSLVLQSSEVEDSFTDVLRLWSLSREMINYLSLCKLGKP